MRWAGAIRFTPATEAGLATPVRSIAEIVGMLEQHRAGASRMNPSARRRYARHLTTSQFAGAAPLSILFETVEDTGTPCLI